MTCHLIPPTAPPAVCTEKDATDHLTPLTVLSVVHAGTARNVLCGINVTPVTSSSDNGDGVSETLDTNSILI